MEQVCHGVYLVAGGHVSGSGDAMSYLVQAEKNYLIDAGAELNSGKQILERIERAGQGSAKLADLLITHCHVDHIGGVQPIVEATGCEVICHEADASAVESGDPLLTAANWYDVKLPMVTVTQKLHGNFGNVGEIGWVHTPGHTPGSVAFTFQSQDGLVLFGQDIHGPFSKEFNSDITLWAKSMKTMIGLEADILCEGHFGVYKGKEKVRTFIEGHLQRHGFA